LTFLVSIASGSLCFAVESSNTLSEWVQEKGSRMALPLTCHQCSLRKLPCAPLAQTRWDGRHWSLVTLRSG